MIILQENEIIFFRAEGDNGDEPRCSLEKWDIIRKKAKTGEENDKKFTKELSTLWTSILNFYSGVSYFPTHFPIFKFNRPHVFFLYGGGSMGGKLHLVFLDKIYEATFVEVRS